MSRFRATALATLALALAACGKKRDLGAEVRECSNIALDSASTAQCLVQLFEWKPAEASVAAGARHRELDSLKRHEEDSVWALDAARHRRDLTACRRSPDPMRNCLLVSGWPLNRVEAAVESLWRSELPKHRREIQACQRRRDVNLASCLTLYYKWESARALRTADSITRARLGGRPAR